MILIRRAGASGWHAPTITAYENESRIQSIIQESPHLLPGGEGLPMVMVSELSLPDGGSVDLVGVSADGAITIVECKLRANPEIRRSVIGQVLSYAANLWSLPYEEFDRRFSLRRNASLVRLMAEQVEDFDDEAFRGNVTRNLHAGRFRLVIAVDAITDELKRIVLFLNQHTNPELDILALELGYVADEGVEILVPTTYGVEAREEKQIQQTKQVQAARTSEQWDEARLFEALALVTSPAALDAARRLFDFAVARGASFYWAAGQLALVTARWPLRGKTVSVFTLYDTGRNGHIAFNFEYIRPQASDATIARFASELRAIPAIANRMVGLEEAGYKLRRSLVIDDMLQHAGALDIIESAIDELLASE